MATKVWNLATVILVGARPAGQHAWKSYPPRPPTTRVPPYKPYFTYSHLYQGPLPTRVKSRDHETVRKCPKAFPRLLQNHVVWSQALDRSVKSCVTWPSTTCYFNGFLFMLFQCIFIHVGHHT